MPRVAYSIAQFGNDLVSRCLSEKRRRVLTVQGIGPHSCCAMIEYTSRGQLRYAFGNSQHKNPIAEGIYSHGWMKCHGEASAIMAALERAQIDINNAGGDLGVVFNAIYIELSPCVRCAPLLNNVAPNMPVSYSFLHPGEVNQWQAAATNLCR